MSKAGEEMANMEIGAKKTIGVEDNYLGCY